MVKRRNSGGQKRLYTFAELQEAIEWVNELAEAAQVKVALGGGLAMQLYGSDRLTSDVDIIAERDVPGMEEIGRLSFGGQKARGKGGVPTDIIVREDEVAPLYEDALQASHRVEGMVVRVVQPEFLAVMKLWAGREDKDIPDVKFLIREELIDLPLTRKLMKKYLGIYAVKDFDSLVREVAWQASEEK